MKRSGKFRFRHINQKIGFGYLLAIATGFVGSIGGMLVADYYQGLALVQLAEAQIQSALLDRLKDKTLQIQIDGLQTAYGIGDTAWLQDRRELLRLHVQDAEQLNQKLQAFLAGDPNWLATDQRSMQMLLAQIQLALQAYGLLVEVQLDTLQANQQAGQGTNTPTASNTQITTIARSSEARKLEQLSKDLAALQAVARAQENQAGDIMEQAQGFEKLMIVVSSGLAVLIAGGVAWRTTRSISQPIVQITQLAERAAEEEQFDVAIPIQGDDEVASLGQSLNQLIQKVAVHNQALQQAAKAADDRAQQLQELLTELQVTQTQLIQTEKMSSLGQLVAGIAHEINNPLTFIRGNLEYAQDYAFDLLRLAALCSAHRSGLAPEVEQHLEQLDLDFLQRDVPRIFASMRTGSDRIRVIVESLRNFSRLDEMGVKTIDLHEGLESTLILLSNRLRETKHRPAIQIIRDYADLPLVECDIGQINQVFMNVLANAIDAIDDLTSQSATIATIQDTQAQGSQGYTGSSSAIQSAAPAGSQDIFEELLDGLSRGEKFIQITTCQHEPERVMVQISNNGPLIPEAQQSKLFDPFYTTKPPGHGTGNGLFICYQIIVEQHGGRLWCRSDPTTGVTFGIELPIKLNRPNLVSQRSQIQQTQTAFLPQSGRQ